MNTSNTRTRKNRLLLVSIFALFFTPLLLAMLMRSEWWDFTPAGSTNAGQLLETPVPLDLSASEWRHGEPSGVTGKWTLTYVMGVDCDAGCEQQITSLRQVHKASGRNQDRVAVLLLTQANMTPETVEALSGIYDKFHVVALNDDAALKAAGATAGQAFIVDPVANIILSYGADFVPADINGDLKRLLKYSAQGDSS